MPYIQNRNHHVTVSAADVLPFDWGDLCYDLRFESQQDVFAKIRHISEMIIASGGKPLMLGGDHTVSKPVLDTILNEHERLTIVHLDAHTDRYHQRISNHVGITNGNVFQKVMEHPRFHRLIQLGIREFEWADSLNEDSRCMVISAYDFQRNSIPKLLHDLHIEGPIYLSVDADVFDPLYAPEVEWPVMGGLTYYQVYQVVEHLQSHCHIVGADFVEVAGRDHVQNMAASCLANLITLLILQKGEVNR